MKREQLREQTVYVDAPDDSKGYVVLWDEERKEWDGGTGVEKKENMIILTKEQFQQMAEGGLSLQEKIRLVTEKLLSEKPGVSYSVIINIWDDGTDRVEARHGDNDLQIYRAVYYDGRLEWYQETYNPEHVMYVDKEGNEIYFKQV